MIKRVLSVVLAITIVLVLISGCAKDTAEVTGTTTQAAATSEAPTTQPKPDYGDTGGLTLPLSDKVVTVTTVAQTNCASLSDKWVFEELLKRTNVKVEVTCFPTASYADKVKVMISSGSMTDISPVGTEGQAMIDNSGMAGKVVAINKYADMLPNYRKLIEKYPYITKSFSASDGNLYYYPSHELNRDVNHGYLFRKDIFDKNGIKAWTNTDEFYAALKKLKEIYPDKYPFTNKNLANAFFRYIAPNWGFQYSTWGVYYDYSSNTWKPVATDTNFKDMVSFWQKLYKEKLVDPEFLTNTTQTWTTKMTTDASFVTFDWIGRMELLAAQLKDTNPGFDLRYGLPIGPVAKNMYLAKVERRGLCVTDNDKKEVVLKLIDYFSSPSGTELLTMGAEGQTYTKDNDGKFNYIGYDAGVVPGIQDLEDKYGLFIQPLLYTRMDARSVYFNYSAREKEAQDMLLQSDKIIKQEPILIFTKEEQEMNAKVFPELRKSMEEFASTFILDSNAGEAEWEAWIKKTETLGLKEVVDIYNAAQKRYDAAK